MPYRTASVEILEGSHEHRCDLCPDSPSRARYNVFDGNSPKYTCGTHLSLAVHMVATRKGT